MADVVDGDIIQTSFRGLVYGQRMITVLHWRVAPFSTVQELQAFYFDFNISLGSGAGSVYQKYVDCLASSYEKGVIRIQKIFPTRMIHMDFNQDPGQGTIAGAALSPGTSGAITKRGEIANRHSIGGVRMPSVPVAWSSSGLLTSPGIGAYASFANTLNDQITTVGAVTLEPIIFNRTAPANSQKTTTLVVQDTIRTMARRVLRRGE